jgi:V8-like Glu-specific endopeptidase
VKVTHTLVALATSKQNIQPLQKKPPQGPLKKIIGAFLCVVGLFSCAPSNETKTNSFDQKDPSVSANVIYGSDGRLDVYQLTDDRLKKLASSTVALVKNSDLSSSANGVTTILGHNFGSDYNLCSSEKFKEQDTAAFCSGSLVGPDLILTAGHCIETVPDCSETSMVFGFAVQSAGVLPKQVKSTEVYKCKEIVKTIRVNTGVD